YWLANRHKDKLVIDVIDLVASRLGSAIHDSIEKVETENVTKEERLYREVQIEDTTYTISGKFDIMVKEGNVYTLRDIKTTSVWAYIYGSKDNDYREQLSVYRWLASVDKEINPNGFIDFFFTDWQSVKSKDEGYPSQRVI